MAGLPYSCRCFTVTGNVAPMPNPNLNPSGSAHQPPATDCNGDAIQLAYSATVLQPKPNRLFFGPTAPGTPATWTAPQKCQVLIHATAAGGGGGGCAGEYDAFLYSADCHITHRGTYSGSPGGNGGPGASVLNRWFQLNAGDSIVMDVGAGGLSGLLTGLPAHTPAQNYPAIAGGNTIITIANQEAIFLPGGFAGAQGSYPIIDIVYNTCNYGLLITQVSGAYQTIIDYCGGASGPYGLTWSNSTAGLGNDFCTVTGVSSWGPSPTCYPPVVVIKDPIFSSQYGAGACGQVYDHYSCPASHTLTYGTAAGGDGLVVIDYIPCTP